MGNSEKDPLEDRNIKDFKIAVLEEISTWSPRELAYHFVNGNGSQQIIYGAHALGQSKDFIEEFDHHRRDPLLGTRPEDSSYAN